MPAAAGRITDLQIEDGVGCLVSLLTFDPLSDDWLQGRIQEALDQGIGCVVGAGRLALVPSSNIQLESPAGDIHGRVEFQERFVDRPKLLGAEVAVIHAAAGLVLFDKRQSSHRREQLVVADQDRVLDRLGRPCARGR